MIFYFDGFFYGFRLKTHFDPKLFLKQFWFVSNTYRTRAIIKRIGFILIQYIRVDKEVVESIAFVR